MLSHSLFYFLLQVSMILRQSMADRTTAFPIFKPDNITRKDTDPEPIRNFYTQRYWGHVRAYSLQQGLLYAGLMEFNWVVTVEVPDQDPEKWSIGNLVTSQHVLTSCQAVITWKTEKSKVSPTMVVLPSVQVVYGTPYLRGNYDARINTHNEREDEWLPNYEGAGGTRTSRTIILNKDCELFGLLNDFALIELQKVIPPVTPILGYMPVLRIENKPGDYLGPNMTEIYNHHTPCHVVSYGRPFYNFQGAQDNIIENFKIKFRVYHISLKTCLSWIQEFIHSGHFRGEGTAVLLDKAKTRLRLWCFWPRKRVGAICDHDRGAPLVCNGYVYGVVVRGVTFRRCDSLIPIPVLIGEVAEYVEELYYQFDTGSLLTYKEASNSYQVHLNLFLIVGLFIFKCITSS